MDFYKCVVWTHRRRWSLLITANTPEHARIKIMSKLMNMAETDIVLSSYINDEVKYSRYEFSVEVAEKPIDMSISNGIIPILPYSSDFRI